MNSRQLSGSICVCIEPKRTCIHCIEVLTWPALLKFRVVAMETPNLVHTSAMPVPNIAILTVCTLPSDIAQKGTLVFPRNYKGTRTGTHVAPELACSPHLVVTTCIWCTAPP